MDHEVVLRNRVLDHNEPLPAPTLSEIVAEWHVDGGDTGAGGKRYDR